MYLTIKKLLKRSKIILELNRIIKAKNQKKQYVKISNYYDKIKKEDNTEISINHLNDYFKNLLLRQERDIRVLFVGTDYHQDYGGFIQELENYCSLSIFTQFDGNYGQYNPNEIGECGRTGRELNTLRLEALLSEMSKSKSMPDIILMQALGWSFQVERLMRLKEQYNLRFFNICLDDKLVFHLKTPKFEKFNYGSSGLIELLDLALVANKEVVEWYRKESVPAIYFPMASSPKVYHPLDIEKIYEVGFIGSNYGYRTKLVNKLVRAGIKVRAHGDGWDLPKLKLEQNNLFMNQCKIVLGIGTIGHCEDLYTSKLRDFEATMSGAVYITHEHKDIIEQFTNEEIILCKSEEEFVEKIQSLLKDDAVMQNIRQNAYRRALSDHTHSHRFEKLFKMLGAVPAVIGLHNK